MAYWMHANSKAIYNCTFAPASFSAPEGTKLTYNPATKRLYLHLFEYTAGGTLRLPGYAGKIRYAQLLNDDSELLYSEDGNDLILKMPKVRPPYEIPVVELMLQ
jgi:alpha-L-fucosidase